jgi:hypothetical protein
MLKLPLFLALAVASVSAQDKTIDVRDSTISFTSAKPASSPWQATSIG